MQLEISDAMVNIFIITHIRSYLNFNDYFLFNTLLNIITIIKKKKFFSSRSHKRNQMEL